MEWSEMFLTVSCLESESPASVGWSISIELVYNILTIVSSWYIKHGLF